MTTPVTPQQMDQSDRAADRADTKSTARRMASIIATGMRGEETPPAPVTETQTPETVEEPQSQTIETAQTVPVTETPEPAEEAEVIDVQALERALQEAGVDLGISLADVPEELQPVYAEIVQKVATFAEQTLQRNVEASDAVRRFEDFGKILSDKPDHILLTLAVHKPEVFAKAVEVFQEMQQDPRVKDMVVRELESEARLREADRKESSIKEYDQRMKARRVIAATQVASRKYGIPFTVSERMVASIVAAEVSSGGDGELTHEEVDKIVGELAADLKGTTTKAKIRVATPQKVQQAKTAPTTPIAGTGTAPVAPGQPASPGLTGATPHQKLLGLVRAASSKITGSHQ